MKQLRGRGQLLFGHTLWKRFFRGKRYKTSVRDQILRARTAADASSTYFDALTRNRWASEGTRAKWRRALEAVQQRDLRAQLQDLRARTA